MISTRTRVLITVKAAPEPSKSYIDTVCVAGIRLHESGAVDWVRIYPVAFRHLATDKQFAKYEIINVDLTRSTTDARRESHRPNWETLAREGGGALSMQRRQQIVDRMIGPSMCDLRSAVVADMTAQSLGLVEVRELRGLVFEDHGPWTEDQVATMKSAMSQPDLFGEVDNTPELVPPRYKVKYSYLCVTEACPGHEQRILDWELAALQFHNRHLSDEGLRARITVKFLDEMWNERVRTYFFVGNFADVVKRKNFSVLGVYRPPRRASRTLTFF